MKRSTFFSLYALTSSLSTLFALQIPADVFSLADLQGADTRPITSLHVFGDSYSDNCNALRFLLKSNAAADYKWPKCFAAPDGRADNAISWPEIVGKMMPAWNISIYAVQAATCDASKFFKGSVDFKREIALFTLQFGNNGFPKALQDDPATSVAAVLIGGNDLALIQQKAWATMDPGSRCSGTVEDSAACIKSGLNQLHSLGFRRFLLFEQPPIDKSELLGSTSERQASTASIVQRHNALTRQYALNLTQQWNDNSTISIFPLYKLLNGMVTLQPAYELKHGAGTYCNSTCRYPFDYAWTDRLHVSYRVFELMANAVVRFLVPSPEPLFADMD